MKKHLIGQLADLQPVQQFRKVDQFAFVERKTGIDLIVGNRTIDDIVFVPVIDIPAVGFHETGPFLIGFPENPDFEFLRLEKIIRNLEKR